MALHEKSDAITFNINANSNLSTIDSLVMYCVSPKGESHVVIPTLRDALSGTMIYRPSSVDEFTPGVWTFYLKVVYQDGKTTYSDSAKFNISKIGA